VSLFNVHKSGIASDRLRQAVTVILARNGVRVRAAQQFCD
jgi:hypothetical protein